MADTFSRRTRRELKELRHDYDELEGKYDDLRDEHDQLQEEAGEKTNMRISYIEEEIETMNQRVEKMATDSYAMRSEVREIHESVREMRTALADIVSLYKSILSRYGFVPPAERPPGAPAKGVGPAPDGEPGDQIIEALQREHERREGARAASAKHQRSRTVPPRPTPPPASSGSPPPTPGPVTREPSTTNALDELHRVARVHQEGEGDEAEPLTGRLARGEAQDSRVVKVARRDMGRRNALDREVEGEFTRSLPKKSVSTQGSEAGGKEWEPTGPPDDRERPKGRPRLHDLLTPE